MNVKSFIARPEWELQLCPVCHNRLGAIEVSKRRRKKIFKCRKCGSTIDERFIFIRW